MPREEACATPGQKLDTSLTEACLTEACLTEAFGYVSSSTCADVVGRSLRDARTEVRQGPDRSRSDRSPSDRNLWDALTEVSMNQISCGQIIRHTAPHSVQQHLFIDRIATRPPAAFTRREFCVLLDTEGILDVNSTCYFSWHLSNHCITAQSLPNF